MAWNGLKFLFVCMPITRSKSSIVSLLLYIWLFYRHVCAARPFPLPLVKTNNLIHYGRKSSNHDVRPELEVFKYWNCIGTFLHDFTLQPGVETHRDGICKPVGWTTSCRGMEAGARQSSMGAGWRPARGWPGHVYACLSLADNYASCFYSPRYFYPSLYPRSRKTPSS
jgi:hypothetical protein